MVTTKKATPARKVAKKRTVTARPRTPAAKQASTGEKPPGERPVEARSPAVGGPKQKLVRDSFTIPEAEYEALAALKTRLVSLARPTRKSELLRAGIRALGDLSDAALMAAVGRIETLKTGRPKVAAGKTAKTSKKKR